MSPSRNVALLALASFFADVSGEMLVAVLPFVLVAQGGTGLAIGLVDGVASATGHLLKPIAGRLADRTGRRKPLIVAGYLIAALSRLGLGLAASWGASLAWRALDRAGKGVRTAPRDALLAESVATSARGRAFGLHRAADTAGAVVGVALALAALAWFDAAASAIAIAAGLIGLLTLAPLALLREAHAREHAPSSASEPASPRFGGFVAIASLFALGQVSVLFYLLRAAEPTGGAGAVALFLLFNVVYFAAAYPAGRLADRVGKPRVLLAGWLLSALASALLAFGSTSTRALVAFAILGLAYALFEGVQRAFAADLAGSGARGARLGLFHGAVGIATLAGGITAGLLWDGVGPWATFAWGAAIPVVAALLLALAFFVPRAPGSV